MLGPRGYRIVDGDVFRRLIVARDYLESCYAAPISLSEAARCAGISRFHFLRSFSRAFGESPHAYLQRVRLERAKERLARGAAVTDACFDVGYSSLGSFSALFARRYGRSPSEWRRDVRLLVAVPEAFAQLYIPCCFLAWWGALPASPGTESQFPRSTRRLLMGE